jgi:hypothetical protein
VLREHHALIHDIRRRFDALRPTRQCQTRQLDGHDLDLDAYVDDVAARRAAAYPPIGCTWPIGDAGATCPWPSCLMRVGPPTPG